MMPIIHIDHDGGVATLRLDRPPANALNPALLEALLAALADSQADGVRGIVLTGRPGMFSAGLDVPEMLRLGRDEVEAFWRLFFRVNRALAGCAVPVVCAISGHAPAGGAVLALHCDYRVAAAGSFRIGLNEVQVGLPVPPTILAVLAEVTGPQLARRMARRGELLTMDEALAAGLVDALAEPDDVLPAARRFLDGLLALPPVAMNTTRLAIKARLLALLGDEDDAVLATGWWFSEETRRHMQALAERLASKG